MQNRLDFRRADLRRAYVATALLAFVAGSAGCLRHPTIVYGTGGGPGQNGVGVGGMGIGGGGGAPTGIGGGPQTGAGGGKMSCGDGTLPADKKMPGYPAAQHKQFNDMAKSMLQGLTLAEKAQQMRGTDQPPTSSASYYIDIFRQPDNSSKGIKGFFFRDGPRGVNLDAPIYNGGSLGRSTVFPVPAARGASFDVDLEYRIGQAMGDEMVAARQTMLLAPTTNILRNPLWGRAQETYGDDPFLLGRLGSAAVAGIQEYVPACAKHYAANNIENSRRNKNASMDEQTLREVYARHFEMMIKDGGVACIMAAYNPVTITSPPQPTSNCTQNKHLLTDLLRDDFGFQGFTLSDWWAVPGGEKATPNASVAAAAVNAGLDMELPMKIHYGLIESLVGSTISQAQVDASVTRILEQKLRFSVASTSGALGLQAATTTLTSGSIANNQAHIDLAEEAAIKSMVLLKNDSATLPIKRTSGLRIAVVGTKESYAGSPGISNPTDDVNGGTIDFPTGVRVGDVGSSRVDFDSSKAVGPFDGIRAAAGAGITVMSGNTVPSASSVYFIVVVAGLTPYDEGEE